MWYYSLLLVYRSDGQAWCPVVPFQHRPTPALGGFGVVAVALSRNELAFLHGLILHHLVLVGAMGVKGI